MNFATYLVMHPLIITGLSNVGTSLLEKTLNKIRSIDTCTLNLNAIMHYLSQKGCAEATFNKMKSELLEGLRTDPLLNEFRNDPHSIISITVDPQGRCTFKENGIPIITCSRDSSLGKMGIAYFNLAQLFIKNPQHNTEVPLENIA